MKYLDEVILKKREEIKKSNYTTLENGFYIQGKIIKFRKEMLFEQFSISIPSDMRDMPEEFYRIKYPSEFRPEKMLTTLDLSVNMGFSMLQNNAESIDAAQIATRIKNTVQRANPTYLFYKQESIKKIGADWFAFRSRAMDSELYNMILVAPIDNQLILSNFNCVYRYCQEWKPAVLLMWGSIEQIKRKGFLS